METFGYFSINLCFEWALNTKIVYICVSWFHIATSGLLDFSDVGVSESRPARQKISIWNASSFGRKTFVTRSSENFHNIRWFYHNIWIWILISVTVVMLSWANFLKLSNPLQNRFRNYFSCTCWLLAFIRNP